MLTPDFASVMNTLLSMTWAINRPSALQVNVEAMFQGLRVTCVSWPLAGGAFMAGKRVFARVGGGNGGSERRDDGTSKHGNVGMMGIDAGRSLYRYVGGREWGVPIRARRGGMGSSNRTRS